ncbi:MAG TPA: DUF2103 domain-containing protein [Chloroflexota bacterium]|nr:DUF2103 domain-containing protein [Chloroflexota bacterium]
MSQKHRVKGVKREHSVIVGLLPLLERIAAHPTVEGVIPGRITVTRGNAPNLQLRLGPRTISGLKLNARRLSTAQEVFLVTKEPEKTLEFLRAEVKEFQE